MPKVCTSVLFIGFDYQHHNISHHHHRRYNVHVHVHVYLQCVHGVYMYMYTVCIHICTKYSTDATDSTVHVDLEKVPNILPNHWYFIKALSYFPLPHLLYMLHVHVYTLYMLILPSQMLWCINVYTCTCTCIYMYMYMYICMVSETIHA